MATKSIPIVSKHCNCFAISIFVPTPSVQVTKRGFFIFLGILLMAEKAPNLDNISGRLVLKT